MRKVSKNISEIINTAYVKDIMSKKVFSLDKENIFEMAVDSLVNKPFSSIVIVDLGKPVGVVTEKDIIKAFASKKSTKKIKMKDIMTDKMILIDENSSIKRASYIMKKHNAKRLIAVDKNKNITGIITQTDIIHNINRIYENYRYLLWNPNLYFFIFALLTIVFIINFIITGKIL